MISYLIHTADGKILASGTAMSEEAALSNIAGTTNSVVFGIPQNVKPDKYYVLSGALYEIPDAPSKNHVFDYTSKLWIDPRTLADIKSEKFLEINRRREEVNQTSFSYLGKEVACDRLSRSDIDGVNGEITLTGSFPAGWPGGWKCMDNTYIAITTVEDWISFYRAMTAQGTANFNHAQTLKAAVAAANTIAEVEAIEW